MFLFERGRRRGDFTERDRPRSHRPPAAPHAPLSSRGCEKACVRRARSARAGRRADGARRASSSSRGVIGNAAARSGLRTTDDGADGRRLWAYRYRAGGRGSRQVQRGGFGSEQAAAEGLERALEGFVENRAHRDEVGEWLSLTVRRALHRHSRARGEGPPGRCQAATARARRCCAGGCRPSLLEHVRVASVSGKSGAFQA
jgi:hypothetical protein